MHKISNINSNQLDNIGIQFRNEYFNAWNAQKNLELRQKSMREQKLMAQKVEQERKKREGSLFFLQCV